MEISSYLLCNNRHKITTFCANSTCTHPAAICPCSTVHSSCLKISSIKDIIRQMQKRSQNHEDFGSFIRKSYYALEEMVAAERRDYNKKTEHPTFDLQVEEKQLYELLKFWSTAEIKPALVSKVV